MDNPQEIALAKEIAKAMGAPWVFRENVGGYPTNCIANETTEAKLWLHQAYNEKDKVAISGSLSIGRNHQNIMVYRKEGPGKEEVPTIRVAIARGPAVIAKEIERRLLPEYTRILALAVAQRDEHESYEDKRLANLKTLAAICNKSTDKFTNDTSSFSFYRNDGAYGDVIVGGSVELKLRSLTMAQAKTILQLILPS